MLKQLFVSVLTTAAVVACNGDDSGNNAQTTNNIATNSGADTGSTNVLNGATDMGGGGGDLGTTNSMTDMAANNGSPDVAVDMGPPPNPLEGIADATLIQEGFQFTEGPRWFPAESVLRFTDIPANRIYEVTLPDTVSVFREMSQGANGLAFDAQGQLLAAEHGGRRISITRNGQTETLVAQYQGGDLNSPNDVAVHSGGWIYFTDPPYGLGGRPRGVAFNGLYRFEESSSTMVAEWEGAQDTRPNGVSLSPDESVLYLADTADSKVHAFDVGADGALSNLRDFASPPNPDGMAVDRDGNLYVTASTGVEVFAPDGSMWGTIQFPRQPANCAFGGPAGTQLFVTAREGLYVVQMVVPGIY